MAGDATLSAKQVARRLGTDAKNLRKFFRDSESGFDPVGQGGRYDFDPAMLPEIQKKYEAWSAGKTRRNRPTNAEREAAKKTETPSSTAEKSVPRPRRTRNTPPPSPLEEDDLSTRLKHSIGERAKLHGVTTDQRGRWQKLMTPQEALDTVPGLARGRERDAAKAKALNDTWDEALASLQEEERGE